MSSRILVIEDDPLVSMSIKTALKKLGFEDIVIASTYLEAMDKLTDKAIELALVDINLNGKFDGLKLAEQIHNRGEFPFIFLTAYADKKILEEAKKLEPAGYIVKPFDEHDLLAGIEIALYNFSKRSGSQNSELNWEKVNKALIDPLSEREMQVVDLIFKGGSNQDIANKLFLSLPTIKSHLARTYSKLGVNSRTLAMARLRELMTLPPRTFVTCLPCLILVSFSSIL